MRAPSAVFMLLALGASACGAITGLGDYSTDPAPEDASSTRPHDAGAAHDAPSADEASGDDTGERGGADSGDDGNGGAGDANGAGDDASEGGETGDAEPLADAEGPFDAAPDALPPCAPSNCGGCCSGGFCYGGGSTGTCGSGGAQCEACSGSTPVCSSGGSCVAATVDAGPPPKCTTNSCTNKCGGFEMACCKSDGTCGCQSIFPLGCN